MKKWFVAIAIFAIVLSGWLTMEESDPVAETTDQVNVKNFGAKGDGSSDDTKAIQNALNQAKGKTVFFPEGQYSIQYLQVENVNLDGSQATLQAHSEERMFIHIIGDNVSISNLTLDGKEKVLNGIYISKGSQDIKIENTVIQNFSTSNPSLDQHPIPAGIRIEGETANILIDQTTIRNIRSKVKVKSSGDHYVARGVFLIPNTIQNPEKAPQNITVQNSTIDGIGPKDDGDGINVQNFKQKVTLTIKNNTFQNNHKRAIKIQDPGAIITGNTIINSFNNNNRYDTYPGLVDNHDMFSAISVYADDVRIENNKIGGVGSYSAAIDIDSGQNISIKNNTIENGASSRYQQHPLIRVNNVINRSKAISGLTITGNTMKNGANSVYFAVPVRDVTVQNNTLSNIK